MRIEEFAGLFLNQFVSKNIQKTFVMVPCNVFKVLKYKNRINSYKCTGCPKINGQFEMAGIQSVFKIFSKTQKSDHHKI